MAVLYRSVLMHLAAGEPDRLVFLAQAFTQAPPAERAAFAQVQGTELLAATTHADPG